MGNLPWMNWINSVTDITGCSFDPQFRVCDLDQTGEIEGTVTVNGTVLGNADVSIEIDGETINTHTESDGTFKFIGVKNGTYTVSVSTENDGSATASDIVVSGNATANCTVEL